MINPELSQYLVRPVAADDFEAVMRLAKAVGDGMTTLPADEDTIHAMIDGSLGSFGAPGSATRFALVLDHVVNGVVGIASVIVRAGGNHGFYSYKRTRLQNHSEFMGLTVSANILSLANDYTSATEVGTLYVLPEHRAHGTGRFLARSRYMLMACAPDAFSETVMAEMRGWQTESGRSPFWDAVGAKFFGMSFEQADKLSATKGNRFIAELLPRLPLYEDLLPDAAQEAIAKPHRASAPAMKMLLDEGFSHEGYVDVFDAGPCVHAKLNRIKTITTSRPVSASVQAEEPNDRALYLAAPTDIANFRCTRAALSVHGGVATLSAEAAKALCVIDGQTLRISPL